GPDLPGTGALVRADQLGKHGCVPGDLFVEGVPFGGERCIHQQAAVSGFDHVPGQECLPVANDAQVAQQPGQVVLGSVLTFAQLQHHVIVEQSGGVERVEAASVAESLCGHVNAVKYGNRPVIVGAEQRLSGELVDKDVLAALPGFVPYLVGG